MIGISQRRNSASSRTGSPSCDVASTYSPLSPRQHYRYYNPTAVARLQRILLMRRLGMGLPAIAEVWSAEMTSSARADLRSQSLSQNMFGGRNGCGASRCGPRRPDIR
ncbi:MerR family transcriptional regulator [Streptosporangium sp. KLBMP 9127]|nr:MerR family transcriptional regulator [Streptosporangium sp. KLBMP 9127]